MEKLMMTEFIPEDEKYKEKVEKSFDRQQAMETIGITLESLRRKWQEEKIGCPDDGNHDDDNWEKGNSSIVGRGKLVDFGLPG